MQGIQAVLVMVLIAASVPPLLFGAPVNAWLAGQVFDGTTSQLIPCTVAIKTSRDATLVQNPDFAEGFWSNGQFKEAVPPGHTIVTVSRGFDYVAERRTLDLRPGQTARLTVRLYRQAHLRRLGWYCGDSHIHMIHGSGKIRVGFPYLALAGRASGLDYMSVAQDWNLPPRQLSPARLTDICERLSTPDFILNWNMEEPKNYWRGDVTHCLGHCWELGMAGTAPRGRDPIRELLQLSAGDFQIDKTPTPNFESQAVVHALGGLVAYTHPCRWWWGDWGGNGAYPREHGKFISNLAQELPYDTVVGPTYDAMDVLMQPWDKEADLEAQKLWFLLLSHGYHTPGTASTDSDFNDPDSAHPGAVRVYTNVAGPPSIVAIARAMKAGRNFVSSGPLLLLTIGGHQPGDVIRVSQTSAYQVKVRAWPSGAFGERLTRVELIRNGKVVRSFAVTNARKEFTADFPMHERGTAWYIARCFGSTDLQVAITNPIYFENQDYRPPQPTPARVTGFVTDQTSGQPLSGTLQVVRMVGLSPTVLSTQAFTGGRFTADVPGTARLRVEVPGYQTVMKSVFMDDPSLLRLTLNMREAELTDWRTFEEIKRLLANVRLNFRLAPTDQHASN